MLAKSDIAWDVPDWVGVCVTTVDDGNFAISSGHTSREALRQATALEHIQWLGQVHGTECVRATASASNQLPEADASFADQPSLACAVLTADCLPILLVDVSQKRVAAVHAGWRGLLAGVIEACVEVAKMGTPLDAWIGPAIGPCCFEIGAEVREAFCDADPLAAKYFVLAGSGKWLGDLPGLAQARLQLLGAKVSLSGWCTLCDLRFHSHRRQQRERLGPNRMASLVWIRYD